MSATSWITLTTTYISTTYITMSPTSDNTPALDGRVGDGDGDALGVVLIVGSILSVATVVGIYIYCYRRRN